MDRESYVLPGILIVILIVILVLVVAFSGDKTFNMGQVSFQYPAGWSESSTTGNFSNTSLYSEVTLTYDVIDSSGSTQTAYIIVQIQQKAKGVLNLPGTSSIIANNTRQFHPLMLTISQRLNWVVPVIIWYRGLLLWNITIIIMLYP